MGKEPENTDIPAGIELTPAVVRRWSEAGGDWHALPEVSNALAQFRGQGAQSKRTTVLELVRAELEGRPENSVWSVPGTCARSTYHGKWKKNDQFVAVARYVRDVGIKYSSTEQARQVLASRDWLRKYTTNAAFVLTSLVTSSNEQIAYKAARAVLDITGASDHELSDADLARLIAPEIQDPADTDDRDGESFEDWLAGEQARAEELAGAEDLLGAWDEDDDEAEL